MFVYHSILGSIRSYEKEHPHALREKGLAEGEGVGFGAWGEEFQS